MAEEDSSVDPKTKQKKGVKMRSFRWRKFIWENLLILLLVLAVFLGVGMGMALRTVWSYTNYKKIWYLEFPGRLLLNMLGMMVLPLIVSSLVVSIADIGTPASRKLGFGIAVYYLYTTMFAVIIGILVALFFHPGSAEDGKKIHGTALTANPVNSILDIISQCFPDNLVLACFEKEVTYVKYEQSEPRINKTDGTNYTVTLEKYAMKSIKNTNVLGIVVFSIALGVGINHLGRQATALKSIFVSVNTVIMVCATIVIWYTPIGIMFLIAGRFVATKDLKRLIYGLGKYAGTVIFSLLIHSCVVLPFLFILTTRRNPTRLALNMAKALFTAWGTASSSATLPLTMDCLVNKNKMDINVVRFVAPIGATINMDGTALYHAVACIFIAQVNGMTLTLVDIIVISLSSTFAAIGTAGIPQAGPVLLVIVLTSVGLPTDDVTYVLSIDWLIDRFNTVVNVWGDAVGCGILNHFFRDTELHFRDTELHEAIEESDSVADEHEPHQPGGKHASLSHPGTTVQQSRASVMKKSSKPMLDRRRPQPSSTAP